MTRKRTYSIVNRKKELGEIECDIEVQVNISSSGMRRAGHGRRGQGVEVGFNERLGDGGVGGGVVRGGSDVAQNCAVGRIDETLVAAREVGLCADPVVVDLLVRSEDDRVALAS
jgi:hypothetical protein